MKYPEITFHTVLHAFRRQWKLLLGITLLAALLGAGAGVAFADRASAQADGSAEPLKTVSFDDVYESKDYYADCKDQLFLRHADAVTYVQAVSEEGTLTENQNFQLQKCLQDLETFKQNTLQPIQSAFELTDALYLPSAYLDAETARYQSLRESTRRSLLSAEAAVELLKTMDAPDVGDEAINGAYASLLSSAAQYGALKTQAEYYDALLSKLENNRDRVVEDSRWMNRQLEDAARSLTALQEEVVQTLDEIAAENHLNIHLNTAGDTLQFVVDHTHTLATPQEAFAAYTLFFTLTGACAAMFLAVCREAKKKTSL